MSINNRLPPPPPQDSRMGCQLCTQVLLVAAAPGTQFSDKDFGIMQLSACADKLSFA
jgi:hypothetical protein